MPATDLAALRCVSPVDDTVLARVRAEFSEMPGLRLTLPQASRLFNLDPVHCSHVLNSLVAAGAIWTNGREFLAQNVGRPSA